MDMIGVDRQFHDLPSLLGARLLHQPPTVYGNRIFEDSLAARPRPDEVIEDEMNPVFVALVLHRPAVQLLISLLTGEHRMTTTARMFDVLAKASEKPA
jgi:hypothetical protein